MPSLQENKPKIFLKIISFLSMIFGLGCLLFMYRIVKKPLADFNPGMKFLIIKLTVFVPTVHNFILVALVSTKVIAEKYGNDMDCLLTCLEMIPFSMMMAYKFHVKEMNNRVVGKDKKRKKVTGSEKINLSSI